MTKWFGPSWGAPVNYPADEMSVPLGEHCIDCLEPFEHGDQGLAIPASLSITANGQVFYHLNCFLREIGAPTGDRRPSW